MKLPLTLAGLCGLAIAPILLQLSAAFWADVNHELLWLPARMIAMTICLAVVALISTSVMILWQVWRQ